MCLCITFASSFVRQRGRHISFLQQFFYSSYHSGHSSVHFVFFYLFFHFLYLVLMVNYLRYLFIYMVTVPVMNMKIYTYINVYIFHGCSRLSAGRRNVFGLPFHLSYCLLSESNAFTHNTHNRMTLLRYRA